MNHSIYHCFTSEDYYIILLLSSEEFTLGTLSSTYTIMRGSETRNFYGRSGIVYYRLDFMLNPLHSMYCMHWWISITVRLLCEDCTPVNVSWECFYVFRLH